MKHLFTLKRRLLGLLSLTALFVLISALPAKADYKRQYYSSSDNSTWSYNTYTTLYEAINNPGDNHYGWVDQYEILADGTITDNTSAANANYNVIINSGASVTWNAQVTIGTVTIYGSLYTNSTLTATTISNNGTFNIHTGSTVTTGAFSNGSGSHFLDEGTMTSGNFSNATSDFINKGSLTISGTANSNSGTITNYKTLNVTAGTFTNTGTINNNKIDETYIGSITISSGTVNNGNGTNGGTINNSSSCTISVTGGTLDNLSPSTLTNNGTVSTSGAGALKNESGSTSATSKFVNNGTITINSTGANSNSGYFENNPTGTLNFTSGTYTNTGVINNDNTITVNGGTLSNTTGTIQNNIGKTINVTSGTLANGTTGVFTNDGTVSVTGTGALTNTNATANNFVNGANGTITFNSTGANSNSGYMENKGAFEVKSGNLTNTGTINNDKTITVSGGTLTNNANGVIENNDTINVTSGELANAAGTLNNIAGHKINVSGGTFSNGTSGVFTNANTADLNVSGTGIFTNANTSTTGFVNKGTITMTSTGTSTNSGYIENGTTGIVNVNAGELQSTGTINNDNTINVGGGILNNTTGAIYNNKDKNINVTSGSLKNGKTFNDDGTVTLSTTGVLDNSGAFTISATGKLTNNSTTAEYGVTNTGTIINSGTVDGSGTMDNAEKGVFTNSNAYTMTGKVTNAGTVNFTTTPATIQDFDNSGALNVNKTTLTVASGKTLTNKASTGTIHILEDSELDVTGTLDNFGTITNDGTLVTTATNGTITNEAKSTLINNATFHNNGVFTVNPNSTFTGNGVFDGTGTYNATGKYVITSDMTINKPYTNNADLEIADNVTVTVTPTGSLTNANKITIDSDADANGTPGKLIIQGTLTNNADKTITNNGLLENDSIFTNAGTFTNTSLYKDTTNAVLNNTGKLDNQVNGTMTFLGKLDNQATGEVSNAGTMTNKNILSNEGKFTNTGTLANNATITNTGTLSNNGTYTDVANATLTNSNVLDNVKGATMTILGGLTNEKGATLNNHGALTNKGNVTNNGTFNNSGTYDDVAEVTTVNTGAIDNKADAVMTIAGVLDTQNGTYNNDGNINILKGGTIVDKKRNDGHAFSVTGNGVMTLNPGSSAILGSATAQEKFIGNENTYDIQSAKGFTVQNKEVTTTAAKPSGKQQFITSDADADVIINNPVTIPAGVVYDFSNVKSTTANADVTVNGTFMDKTGTMPSIAGPGKFVYNVGSYGYLGDLLLIDKTGAVLDLEKGTIEVTAKTITLPSGADVTITQDWTNPVDETFAIETGAVLGITSHTFTNAGALDVEGTMNVNNSGTYIIKDQGTEEVNGMINVKSAGVYKDSRANSTWTGEGTINYYDGSEGWLGDTKYIGKKNDAAALMQLASGIIELKSPGTEVGDKTYEAGVMTLKANSEAFSNGFTLAANQLATVEPGAKLSIADGAKLNIDGDLVINDKGQVIVPNNTTYTIEKTGTEQIDGKITVENGGKFYDTRTAPVIKAGSLGYIEYMAGSEGYLGTEKYIGDNTAKIALTSGSIKLDVLHATEYPNGEMTLVAGSKATSNDFESSAGQLMTIQKGATLDIASDKSFTNGGDLVIDGTDGTLDVKANGTYVNNGNQRVNGIIHVENYGKLVDNTAPYTVNGAVNTDVNTTTPATGKIIYELGGMGYHGTNKYVGPDNTYPLQLTYGKIEQAYEPNFVGDHYTLTDGSKASANNYTLSGDPENRHLTISKNAELTVTKAKAITIDGTLTIDKEGKLIVPSNATYTIEKQGVEMINGEIILQRAQNGVVGGTFNDNRTVPYMAGDGSIVYYSGAQGKVSGHLFIGGPKDTDADVQITDSDGALILHSGDVANTTIYEVASGSEVTSNALKLRVGEKVTLHNAAMVTIPSGKSLTLLDPNSTSQVIFEPQPNNYVTTINLQGNLIMNANGKTLTFTSAKPEYELLLKSLPEVNTTTGTITFPVAKKGISGDSIVWRSTSGSTDYKAGDTYTPAGAETFVANVASSTSQNVSKSTKIANGSFDDIVYGNYNEVAYTISNPNTAAGSAIPTNSELKTLTIKLTGENADMFWLTPSVGAPGTTVSESNITIGSSKDFTVTTKKDGSTYLEAGTYHATVVITGTDALGNTITDSVQIKQVVLKNTPTLSALSASALTYGQTLSESTVTGTATPATNTAGLTIPVAGTYAFTDATLIPEVETEDYEVTFTPTDTKNYNIATGMVSVSVTPVDMSKVTLAPITDQPYTSNFVTPTLSLTYKGMPLVEYEDYQVVYGNNVELSTTNSPATVSIIGMGNYKGTLKSTFKIVNSDLLYFVSIPQVSGITSNPVAGTYYEYKGETFTFSLTLGKTYSKSAPVVKDTEGNVYKADANGIYSIKIDHSVILSIDGVTSNTTGIESLNGMKIWAVGHVLHIYTTKASPVLVVSMNGRMIVSDKLTVGDNSFNIDVEGTYIVKLGSQVVKIYVR